MSARNACANTVLSCMGCSTAEELRKFQATESLKWGRIIKSAGIEAE